MRWGILAAILQLLLFSPAWGIEEDKMKHGALSVAFGAMATSSLGDAFPSVPRSGRWVAGTTLAMIPGLAKEMIDVRFDKADLAADLVGSIVGALLMDLTGGRVWLEATDERVVVGLRFGSRAAGGLLQ